MLKTAPLLLALAFFTNPASADGIDCAKAADAVEKVICSSGELKAQDKTMAELFDHARISAFGTGPSSEISVQNKWLASRGACLKEKSERQVKCLSGLYQSRNLELAYAAMPTAPAAALHVLQDQNVESAPVLEALSLFASEPDGTNWSSPSLETKRRQILSLAAPVLQSVQNGEGSQGQNSHFNKELLDDARVATPDDILKSTKAFAGFVRAATWGTENATLPCTYILSHPELLEATETYFGATPDDMIIRSNCADMTAPVPKLKALLGKINKGWPQCDGTIRFAAYRSFDVAVDEALAPSSRLIQEFSLSLVSGRSLETHRLSGVSRAVIQSARQELSGT